MKTFFLLFFSIASALNLYSQNDLSKLNGYKIVLIPYKFSSLVSHISEKFKAIGFKTYTEESDLKSDPDFKSDPKLVLICDAERDYNYPHTTIRLKLTNLKKELLFEKVENTKGKSFVSFDSDADDKWVVDKIFNTFNGFNYQYDNTKSLSYLDRLNMPKLELTNWNEDSMVNYLSNNSVDLIEGIFKNLDSDPVNYYKLGIFKSKKVYKVIVLETNNKDWKIGEVKAILEPSSVDNIFSIKYYLGDKSSAESFAFFENGAVLSFEIKYPNSDQKFKSTYLKMSVTPKTSFLPNELKGTGTGFFMNINGVIATNAHVVTGAKKIEIVLSSNKGTKTYNAKVLKIDAINDVALLQIEDDSFKRLKYIPYTFIGNASTGSNVFTIGFPMNNVMGTNSKVTNGIISANSGIGDDVRFYQITVPLQPGNSGGPLFNSKGNIVGITTSTLNDDAIGTKTNNVFYSIKINYLLLLYGMLPNAPPLNTTPMLVGKPLESQVKILQEYVCIVKVY